MRPASPRWGLLLLCAWMVLSGTARAVEARIGSNENFNVLASTPELMRWALVRCNELRREIALEWLGEELPPGAGYAHLHIEVCQDRKSAKTLPSNPATGRNTMVWVACPGEFLDATIAHEMVHVIFGERFPEGMPIWADEGIACRYDYSRLKATRARLIAAYDESSWPSIRELISGDEIAASDMRSYAMSESLVEYLLTLGSGRTLIEFVADSRTNADEALARHYRIASVEDLERRWKLEHLRANARVATRGTLSR